MTRRFDRSELAFFAVPRTWREIEMRFGSEAKTEPFRDCVILADNEGGSGDLKYLREPKSWVLTDAGKVRAGERLITRELRVYPDKRQQERERLEAGEAFNEAMEALVDFDAKQAFADLCTSPGPVESGYELSAPLAGLDTTKDIDVFIVDGKLILEQASNAKDELAKLIAEQASDDDG